MALATFPTQPGVSLMQTIQSTAIQGGTTAAAGAAGAAIAGTSVAASLASAGVTAGLSLAVTGIMAWLAAKKRTGQQKVAATTIINDVEIRLKAIKDAYERSAKTRADYLAAKAAQDGLYEFLRSPKGCANPELGSAGQRCLEERLCEEGCKYPFFAYYGLGPEPEPSADEGGGDPISNLLSGTVDVPVAGQVPSFVLLGALVLVGIGLTSR